MGSLEAQMLFAFSSFEEKILPSHNFNKLSFFGLTLPPAQQ
jgi:hypothetical protein